MILRIYSAPASLAGLGLDAEAMKAIGSDELTPVISVELSEALEPFAEDQEIQVLFDTDLEEGTAVYLYSIDEASGLTFYAEGTVDAQGQAAFTVPMMSADWTIGTIH